MGKSAKQIIDIFAKLDPDIEITQDAAEGMTAIPGPFVKMAIKKTIKTARADGVDVIDVAYAQKIRKANFPG